MIKVSLSWLSRADVDFYKKTVDKQKRIYTQTTVFYHHLKGTMTESANL